MKESNLWKAILCVCIAIMFLAPITPLTNGAFDIEEKISHVSYRTCTTNCLSVAGGEIEYGITETPVNENNEELNPSYWTYRRPKVASFDPGFATNHETLSVNPPHSFDLRDVEGKNYVTPIKCQTGGTCWAHAIMAAMESNLLITGNWEKAGETGVPNLAEYHLDWWNGFNTFNNDDVPSSDGLPVHEGAQFRIAAAYFARGEGAVFSRDASDSTEYDDNWYETAPNRFDNSYHLYYPRHIEIYDVGEDLSNIDLIKNKIMTNGAMTNVFRYDSQFISDDFTHYQPTASSGDPNHNVAIIGWDDTKETQAPQPGAWLCKNSWGSSWGLGGYFWISYYDAYCCHPYDGDEWTATCKEVEAMPYKHFYYHDYHGWQDDFTLSNEIFNAFTADNDELLTAVNFYTCQDNVDYVVRVYDQFRNGTLRKELANISGSINHMGFHTYELNQPVHLTRGDQFYIYFKLSDGGIPYDRTHQVWGYTIESVSHANESYYYKDGNWHDLHELDSTANFCIKGLVSKESNVDCEADITWVDIKPGSTVTYNLSITNVGESFSKLDWKISEYPDWGEWTFTPSAGEDLLPEEGAITVQISVIAPDEENQAFSGEIKIVNKDISSDYEIIPVSLATPKNKAFNTHRFLIRFLDQHPHLFPLLSRMLRPYLSSI